MGVEMVSPGDSAGGRMASAWDRVEKWSGVERWRTGRWASRRTRWRPAQSMGGERLVDKGRYPAEAGR